MGTSTDGIVFYGYVWDDEYTLFEEDGEWEEVLLRRRGIHSPYDLYTEPSGLRDYAAREAHWADWRAQHSGEFEVYRSINQELQNEFPVDVGWHGACDGFSCPYIYVKDSEITARRGYPKKLEDWRNMTISAEHLEGMQNFIDALDIDLSDAEGPGWFLVSNWC